MFRCVILKLRNRSFEENIKILICSLAIATYNSTHVNSNIRENLLFQLTMVVEELYAQLDFFVHSILAGR